MHRILLRVSAEDRGMGGMGCTGHRVQWSKKQSNAGAGFVAHSPMGSAIRCSGTPKAMKLGLTKRRLR